MDDDELVIDGDELVRRVSALEVQVFGTASADNEDIIDVVEFEARVTALEEAVSRGKQ